MENLKAFRESTGLSQFSMAKKLDVSLSLYEKIERGHIQASRTFMQRLKLAYPAIDINEMFFNDNELKKVVF
ncbi:helix-turn-helix transcriptional regulator [Tyzzerella sp. OttesenSCG-928-J15]|nr:helix-turn-helix transcriptional regulator [Tyzzerella sp. OttesenSCG-928-J15]